MRIHQGKPFPASFYDRPYKHKHYYLWWCVCNELDADEDGWIHISREEMERVFQRTQQMKPNQLTSIFKTLVNGGYLEFESVAGKRWYSTETYAIRISSDAWEPKQIVKKVYPQRDTRAERRARYERRLLNLASGDQP